MARGKPQPVRITSATRSHSADLRQRERRYIWTMGIRTACFLAAIGCFLSPLPRWVAWVLIVGSLVLPYVAVVMANAGAAPDPGGPDPVPRPAIDTGDDKGAARPRGEQPGS